MTAHSTLPAKDEAEFKEFLVLALCERLTKFPSQRSAAKAWNVAQSTVNVIANRHVDGLTLKQLCNIVWKSGGMIQLGVSYSS